MTQATRTFITKSHPATIEESKLGHIQPALALRLVGSIFSASIQLTALRALLGDGPLNDKAAAIVEELDTVIRDIRAGVSE